MTDIGHTIDDNNRGIGHNSGTPADMVMAELGEKLVEYHKRRTDLLGAVERCSVTDNDTIGKAGDLIAMIGRLVSVVEARAEEVFEPHVLAVNAGRAARDKWTAELSAGAWSVRAKIDAFRAEQRKKAREQQEEQEAIAAAALAKAREAEAPAAIEPPAPAPTPAAPIKLRAVRGDLGSRVGDRDVSIFTIKDPRKVDIQVLNHPKVQEAMQAACRALDRAGVKIKGVIKETTLATTVRK